MIKEVNIKELMLFSVEPKKTRKEINAVRTSHLSDDMVSENSAILDMCNQYYQGLSDFRARRRRARKYYRGDQWHEKVVNSDGKTVTEEELIKENGKVPFKQNVIRQLIRSLLGQYRTNKSKTVVVARKKDDSKKSEMLTNALQTAQQLNAISELNARNMEEMIISGSAIGKIGYSYWKEVNREDIFFENINPNTVFFNTDVRDPRLIDLRVIGEVKDVTLEEIVSTFATNEEEEKKIREWYSVVNPEDTTLQRQGLTPDRMDYIDFYIPSDPNKARLIEVWQLASEWRTYAHDYMDGTYEITDLSLDEIKLINEQRIKLGTENGLQLEKIPLIDARRKKEEFWTVKFLTPHGQCLFQSETVYKHESHPYVMVLYPLLDGEVWGLVEDIIDQQRSINRMISLIDFIMGAAAKGVLLVPEEAIPADMDISDFADEWSKYNGVIKFKSKGLQQLPKQVSANVTNIGAQDMLAMQMKLIQDIAGVSNAIQGQKASPGTPSSLYAQEAMNSTVNTKDMFDSFAWYERQVNTKILKVIQQFYDDHRYIAIAGNRYSKEASYYDPDEVRDTDFDLVVTEGQSSPVYREVINDQLFKLFSAGAIDVISYLENADLPYSDKIIESLKKQKEQLQQGKVPDMPQQMPQSQDPKKQAVMNKILQ